MHQRFYAYSDSNSWWQLKIYYIIYIVYPDSLYLIPSVDSRIGLYGDEANISENVFDPFKVLCIFMNIIHYRPANIRLSRYLIFTIRSEWIAGPETLRPIFLKITESLNLAFDSPDLFPNRERFIVAEFRGDQEFHRKVWQHTAHWLGINVCCKCAAKSTGNLYLYTDLADDPSWADTEYDTVNFINEELPDVPCVVALLLNIFPLCCHVKVHQVTNRICVAAQAQIMPQDCIQGIFTLAGSESGPWLGLKYFDVLCIKVCTMHCVNLGLLYTANGSSLWLDDLFGLSCTFCFGGSRLQPSSCLLLWAIFFWVWTMMFLRNTLVELGCFGDPALQMKALLLEAWEDYRAWCKEQKVNTGQGRFTPGLATQICAMCNLSVLFKTIIH